ncbi:MAG: hypothetical protein M1409_03185 [Actinobacteria bacterium]|nr:hypothetical protein [Actinomycetota bacterium]
MEKRELKIMQKSFNFRPFYFFLILVLFLAFFLISCSALTGQAAQQETNTNSTTASRETSQASSSSAETTGTTQPVVAAEKITKIGAEIIGAIPSFMCTNKTNIVAVEVKNTSDFTWRTDVPNLVRFGYHFYGQDVSFTEYDKTTRTVLPHDVKPGETATVNVEIKDVLNKGTYVIQIDMVLEGNDVAANNFWFSSKGVAMVEGTAYFDTCQ